MNAPLRAYTVFDAAGSKNPAASDLKYYFLLRAWLRRGPLAGLLVDVHERARCARQAAAVAARTVTSADPSDATSLAHDLRRRLRDSDLLLLILGPLSARSRGWLSWEIDEGAGRLGLPIVVLYTGLPSVHHEQGQCAWWPDALARVVSARPELSIRHLPFRARALASTLRAP